MYIRRGRVCELPQPDKSLINSCLNGGAIASPIRGEIVDRHRDLTVILVCSWLVVQQVWRIVVSHGGGLAVRSLIDCLLTYSKSTPAKILCLYT